MKLYAAFHPFRVKAPSEHGCMPSQETDGICTYEKKTEIHSYTLNDILKEPVDLSQDEYPYVQEWITQILSEESKTTKNVFHMRMGGYSFYEISKACHISESSARVIWHRIRTKLQQEYRKEENL